MSAISKTESRCSSKVSRCPPRKSFVQSSAAASLASADAIVGTRTPVISLCRCSYVSLLIASSSASPHASQNCRQLRHIFLEPRSRTLLFTARSVSSLASPSLRNLTPCPSKSKSYSSHVAG